MSGHRNNHWYPVPQDLLRETRMQIFGKLAPPDSLTTPEEVEENAVAEEDVDRMREWSQENRL